MDETGISMSHKPGKVVAQKGVKTVQGKAGSRETITVIACVNPEGSSTPPHFIITCKTCRSLQGYDIEEISKESVIKYDNFSVSDSGWTKDGIARLWFEKNVLTIILAMTGSRF